MLVMVVPIDCLVSMLYYLTSLLQSELSIYTASDLLHFYPFRYIDNTKFQSIKDLNPAKTEIQLKGKTLGIKNVAQKRGTRLIASFSDGTGRIYLGGFKATKWVKSSLNPSVTYLIKFLVSIFRYQLQYQ